MTTEEATRWLMDLRERTDTLCLERDRSIPMAQIEGLSEEFAFLSWRIEQLSSAFKELLSEVQERGVISDIEVEEYLSILKGRGVS